MEKNNLPISDSMRDDVMTNSIWKYYESLDGELLSKDNISYVTNDFNILVDAPFFSEHFKNEFRQFVSTHTEKTPIELCTLMEIKCYASDAIYEIKKLFSTEYNADTNFEVCAKLQSPPVYSLSIIGYNKESMELYLDQCVADIQQKVNKNHTNFKIIEEKKIQKTTIVSLVSFSTQEVNKWFGNQVQSTSASISL